jgi:DNA processing protein
MARLSSATIIVEAGPTSGVIHQAAECLRQKRKLILLKSVAENSSLPWVGGFLKSGALVAETATHLLELLRE